MNSCTYCLKNDTKPSEKYQDFSGNPICGECCVGNLVEINRVDLLVYHDTFFAHGSRLFANTITTISSIHEQPCFRLHNMNKELMQILGCID